MAFLICAVLMSGCGGKDKGIPMQVYFLKSNEDVLITKKYYVSGKDAGTRAEELLYIMTAPRADELRSVFPDGVKVKSVTSEGYLLTVNFSENYSKLEKSEEVFLRAAVVQTLVMIDGVEYVSFEVGGKALTDDSGKTVGLMSADDFVQNVGTTLTSYQEGDLKLYFAAKGKDELVPEQRKNLRYNIDTSLEKLAVEQLMKGPKSDKCEATIPVEAKLLGVSVREGICYINFSKGFLTGGGDRDPEIVIYSIVNSVLASGNASKVKILVEGSDDAVFKGAVDLKNTLEWREDLIRKTK